MSQINISYPEPLVQKILLNEAAGGPPDRVELVIPSRIQVGQQFDLRVAVMDETGYPSAECNCPVQVTSPVDCEIPFESGKPAVGVIRGLKIDASGFHRIVAELDGATFYSNPAFVTVDAVDEQLYWGDPHVHTVLSRCHDDMCRTLNFCYCSARHHSCLDWVGAADHVSNGRCDSSKWKEESTVSNLYNDAPNFVTLPAYEASFKGMAGGDNNVYMRSFPPTFVDDYDEGTVKTMGEKLKELLPESDFFVVPHHTTRTNKHGEIPDDIYLGEDLLPVIEIHSKWGTSEYRGNPEPLVKIHPGPSYAVDLMNKGIKFGFIAGTDSHSTMASGYGYEHLPATPGFTAIRASSLSRDNVFDGIKNRNCYAAKGERIYLEVEFNDYQISGRAAAKGNITSVDFIRNGETIQSKEVNDWNAEFLFTDDAPTQLESPYLGKFSYYYIRVNCENGDQAWSSPEWLQE